MLDRTPFQQFLLPRFANARKRIVEALWQVDPKPLTVRRTLPTTQHRTLEQVGEGEFQPVTQTPLHWGEMFDQCFWQLDLPADDKAAGPRYLYWDDQGEATIYHDGTPYYGIDPGHLYAPLPADAKSLVIESLCARTGVWVDGQSQGIDHPRGSQFRGAYLARRSDDAWHVLHDLDVLTQLAGLQAKPEYLGNFDLWGVGGYRPELLVAEPLLRRLIGRLSEAVDELDRHGIAAMRKVTAAILQEFPAYPNAMKATLTGHAHIDLVWLWPERAGEFKAVHSFANAVRMIEQYPEMTFGYSQPASYEAVERRSPALMKQVRKQIKRGHWEPTGALYVESDVQLPCGEALVRAFELGQKGFRDLRGNDSRCVWIPDVFGYSACLPTIMAGFDVPYFYTTKLHWSGSTRFPHSSFRWVGMDGSEVVSYISWNGYNETVTPGQLRHTDLQHRQSVVHDESLFPCGYGDGGGGVAEGMCERARRMENLASLPRTNWGTIEGFFDRLAEKSEELPAWHGEMYLEFHRGVQTTHSDLKRAFRRAERAMQVWEAVRCATGGGPVDEQMWKRVCFAQFHDYIPGSSIREVYEEHVPELEKLGHDVLAHAAAELAATGDAPGAGEDCVFNPLPVARPAMIDGKLRQLPPLAGVALRDLPVLPTAKVEASPEALSNGRVAATFNDRGEVASLTVDGRSVAWDRPGAEVWTFPDHPANYDAWDVDRFTLSLGTHHDGPAEVSIQQANGQASVAFKRSLGEVGSITVQYRLEPGAAVLRMSVDLDLQKPQTLVKLAFPTQYRGREARYGGPFGSTLRPQWEGPLVNDAMFENPASRWACVADDGEREGLMVLTETKYGFGAREGLLHLSLARSAIVTQSNRAGGTASLDLGGREKDYADLGAQTIELALGAYSAQAPGDEQPAFLVDSLFVPVLRYQGKPIDAGLHGVTGLASCVPCWAKPEAGGDWTLRLHETLGQRGPVQMQLAPGMAAKPTNLKGDPLDAGSLGDLAIAPYTVHSLRIKR